MFCSADSLDDLLHEVLKELLQLPFNVKASRGTSSELFGVLLKLNNPLARLSRSESRGKTFSALGELVWYLSGSDDLPFIEYYIPKYSENSDDGKAIHGAYGPRLFNMHDKYNQLKCVIELLKKSPTTRRAVIQLFDAKDTAIKYKDIPCTCTFQFVIREGKLHMFTNMRSNDAFLGLPHDIFCFTMLQEIIARTVGVELGTYNHSIASLHLYEKDKVLAEEYLSEGYQSTKSTMPAIPNGDPWLAINEVLKAEKSIRTDTSGSSDISGLDLYWIDIITLLKVHSLFKKSEIDKVIELKNELSNHIYNTYIESRIKRFKDQTKHDK